MSASEKLSALDGGMTAGPWCSGWIYTSYDKKKPVERMDDDHSISTVRGGVEVAGNYDYEDGGIIEKTDRDALIALRNALPQIIAAVKRLEWCREAFDYISGNDVAGWDVHVPTEVVAIGARDQADIALVALDEALS